MPLLITPKRIVCHFSCGAASAVATKLVIEKYKDSGIPIVIYNIYLALEHRDNDRFLADCEAWFDMPINVIRNEKYDSDPRQVWAKEKYIVGKDGAPCTRLLKRKVGLDLCQEGDLEVFGFTAEEEDRLNDFIDANPTRNPTSPLIDKGLTKAMCLAEIKGAGIELPMMYRLGYKNNNCIGCPKGGSGYWNKIRRDFPDYFFDMMTVDESIGHPFIRITTDGVRHRVFLKDLPLDAGRNEPIEDISCSYVCTWPTALAAGE